MTPFGVPVVPDVYAMAARASAWGARAARAARRRRDGGAAARAGGSPFTMNAGTPAAARRRRSPRLLARRRTGSPRPAHERAAGRSPGPVDRTAIGTATPPMPHTANSVATTAGSLAASTATGCPLPSPRRTSHAARSSTAAASSPYGIRRPAKPSPPASQRRAACKRRNAGDVGRSIRPARGARRRRSFRPRCGGSRASRPCTPCVVRSRLMCVRGPPLTAGSMRTRSRPSFTPAGVRSGARASPSR